MDTKKAEVEAFLNDFKQKMVAFRVIFLDRKKNLQALFDLEIVRVRREEILKQLNTNNYFRGPTTDEFGPDLWEFGKIVNKKEVYIKITMGDVNKPVICISFHLAEYKIKYPLKS